LNPSDARVVRTISSPGNLEHFGRRFDRVDAIRLGEQSERDIASATAQFQNPSRAGRV
jgi:hypothetical protein